jgi:hypothetical protein
VELSAVPLASLPPATITTPFRCIVVLGAFTWFADPVAPLRAAVIVPVAPKL